MSRGITHGISRNKQKPHQENKNTRKAEIGETYCTPRMRKTYYDDARITLLTPSLSLNLSPLQSPTSSSKKEREGDGIKVVPTERYVCEWADRRTCARIASYRAHPRSRTLSLGRVSQTPRRHCRGLTWPKALHDFLLYSPLFHTPSPVFYHLLAFTFFPHAG